MAENPRTTFHEKLVPKHGWEGGDRAGPKGQLSSTHQILTPSLLSWGAYWLVPLLQSPENQMPLRGKALQSRLHSQPLVSGEGSPIPYPLPKLQHVPSEPQNPTYPFHPIILRDQPQPLDQKPLLTLHDPEAPCPRRPPVPKLLPHLTPPSLFLALVLSRRALITGHKLFALEALT